MRGAPALLSAAASSRCSCLMPPPLLAGSAGMEPLDELDLLLLEDGGAEAAPRVEL